MHITEQLTDTNVEVEIIEVKKDDLPLKKNGWKFNWKTEFKNPDSKNPKNEKSKGLLTENKKPKDCSDRTLKIEGFCFTGN